MTVSVEELLERGWESCDEDDWERAEELGRQALARDAESVEARLLVAKALMTRGEHAEAASILGEAVASDPDDADCRIELGNALFQCCRFAEADSRFREGLQRAVEAEVRADACYGLALCLERAGRREEAEAEFARASELDPEAYPRPARLTRAAFEEVLREAIRQLPAETREALENLVIQLRDLPDERLLTEYDPPLDPGLLGLFEGVPRPEQSLGDAPRLPERISLFQRNLERQCATRDELVDEIVVTLRHEVGHYLGLEEDDLERCGYD